MSAGPIGGRAAWLVASGCAAVLAVACSSGEHVGGAPHRSAVSAAPAIPVAAPAAAKVATSVAGPHAFDLAIADGGAVLVWSPPRALGGGIFVQRLDGVGAPRSAALRLAQTDAGGEVLELGATAVGRRVGVAWVESDGHQARTRALLVEPGEPEPPEPTSLSVRAADATSSPGGLAIGHGRDGRVRVLHATSSSDCGRERSEPCTGYTWSELGEGTRDALGEWLRVPAPCRSVAPMIAGHGNQLYYAVCADADGQPTTTAYGVDLATEYAHAVQVLAGCTPLGMVAPVRGAAWIVGRCGASLRAAELTTDASRGVREHALDGLEAVCVDGAVTLRAGDVALTLAASTPLDGLEALLPSALAGEGSVAVWTGAALLIVRRQAAQLELGRHACVAGALTHAQ